MGTSLKYLRRVLLVAYYDWPIVVRNILNARTVWWRMLRILIREGRDCGFLGFSLKPSSNRCWYSMQSIGWLFPTWADTWGGSSTRWKIDWQVESQGRVLTRRGSRRWISAEYSCPVYCNVIDYGPMWGNGEYAGIKGGDTVVGTGMNWLGRRKVNGGGSNRCGRK